MAEDEDSRHGGLVSSRSVPEAEVLRPEAGEEMDVREPTARPTPTYQEGGSSSSRSTQMNVDVEEQHLDDGIEMHSSKTDGFAGDAATAALDQMQMEEKSLNSFLSRKTGVFEQIEKPRRQCKAEDLNDDEIMEWT